MSARAFSGPAIEAIADLLSARTGLSFAPNRRAEAEAAIGRAMARAHVAEAREYLARLAAGELSLDELVSEVTVGETHFFRHPQQFAWLRERIFPAVRGGCAEGRAVKVWSAGCASGEEAYSVVMAAEQSGLREQVEVVGTDVSPRMIARARQAVYRPWSLRGVDEEARRRYFVDVDRLWRVQERIRRRVSFEVHNLADERGASPVGEMDVVFCRNVLIYLDVVAIRRVQQRLLATLSSGGWLIFGPSDPPLDREAPVETIVTPSGVLYRKRDLLSPSRPSVHHAVSLDERPAQPERISIVTTAPRPVRTQDDLGAATEAARQHPLAPERHLLHAMLLLDLGRDAEAIHPLRRALYLDRTLVIAQFLLGAALRRTGDLEGALRAYRNAHDRAAAVPADQLLPLGDGERAGRLAEAARAEIAALESTVQVAS